MSKENVTGTIVEVSLDQIISEMLSEYVTNLKKDGQKIFVTGDEFSSQVDIKKYKSEMNDVFTDDNIRLHINKDKLKEYIVTLESVDIVINCKSAEEIEILKEAINYCVRILKRNVI